jgi:CO dehydrogenase maturation factor
MGTTLAVAGKGGVGKTSLSALMIKAIVDDGQKPLLAIDADSNSNLHEVLGVREPKSVGCIREDARKLGEDIPGGMTRDRFMEYQIQASLEETRDFDFLSMGRPEGPGCYCMANNILRDVISKLTSNYAVVVIDNEAGMEHLSRRTEEEVDHLFIVSDPAPRSLRTIGRILELIDELGGRIRNKHLIISRVDGDFDSLPKGVKDEIDRLPQSPLAVIPYDEELVNLDLSGMPLIKVSESAKSYIAVRNMLAGLGIIKDTYETA